MNSLCRRVGTSRQLAQLDPAELTELVIMDSLRPRVSIWLMALVLIGLAIGCDPSKPNNESQSTDLPFRGRSAVIAIPQSGGNQENWSAELNEWGTQTGGTGEIRTYPDGDMDALRNVIESSEDPTLVVLSYDELLNSLAQLQLQPIPKEALEQDAGIVWGDLLKGVQGYLGAPRRNPLYLPLAAPHLVLYYRADLLRKAGKTSPETWEDYAVLLESLPEWGGGLTAVEPWNESFRATMFLAKAVSHARHPDNFSVFADAESLEPLIHGPAFVRALDQARNVLRRLPPTVRTLSPGDCRAEILSGRAALAIAYEPSNSGGSSSAAVARPEGIEIGICQLPGVREVYDPTRKSWYRGGGTTASPKLFRTNLTAFSGYAVCAFRRPETASTDIAWSAFAHVAGPDFLSRLPPGQGGLTRESQLADLSALVGPELSGTEAGDYLAVTADCLRSSTLIIELPFPRRPEFRKSLSLHLARAIETDATSEEILNDVAADWRKLIEEIGPEQFRHTYRQMLGLSLKTEIRKPSKS